MNGLYGDVGGLNAGITQNAFTSGMNSGAAWGTPASLPSHMQNITGGIAGLNPQRDAIAQTLTMQQMGPEAPFTPPTAAAQPSFTPPAAATPAATAIPAVSAPQGDNMGGIINNQLSAPLNTTQRPANVNNIISGLYRG